MGSTVAEVAPARHHMLSEIPVAVMAKADLKKVEDAFRKQVGECIARARKSLNWSLKELGGEIQKITGKEPDTAQLSRWEAGTERPHFDALFAVTAFRGPLVIALAGLSDQIEVVTEIRVRRSA